MTDFIGLFITGLSTIFFSIKDPWDRKIWKTRFSFGHIGILFIISGIIVSGIIITNSNKEKLEYKTQLINIDKTAKSTLTTTKNGIDTLLINYNKQIDEVLNNFSENYSVLISTIISQSDSALKAQLHKIKKDYEKLNEDLLNEKSISHRYYFSEEWPFSDKEKNISSEMFFFVPIDLSGLLDGTDRYIIWYLIERDGFFQLNQIDKLHDEIWNYLQPMKLSISINLKRLEIHGVIKPDYWRSEKVEFSDEFYERLDVYKKYKGTDQYIPKLFDLYFKHR